MARKMAKTVLEVVIDDYQASINNPSPSDFLIVTRIHADNWQKHKDSKYTYPRTDNKGFKYDVFHADYPGNPKTSTNPNDLNVFSFALASKGYEVYAFAYREKRYVPVAAAGSKPA